MIRFEIGGRPIDPDKIEDVLMAAVLEHVRDEIREKVGSIREPETGEFPTVLVHGESLDDLRIKVEGSPEVIAQVTQRLGLSDSEEGEAMAESHRAPTVFLSYTSDDAALAGRIAHALQSNGIDTWWDKWCITAGDSLRQKIDEGLAGCTHFLVLLSPRSINKPWVNQEMDAGLVRKLNDACRFLPVRHKLPSSELPPTLSGMYAPEIAADEDITQLINDILGISRKPKLGPVPKPAAQENETKTGYSPAANAIAHVFVDRSAHGTFADPKFDVAPLAEATGLSLPDTKDGLYELRDFFQDTKLHALVEPSLFTEFDKYWKPWDPAEDALKLAADIANDQQFPADPQKITERYGWEPRRLNPAITYLLDRGILRNYKALGMPQFVMVRVVGDEDEIRRFLKSRL